MRIVAVTACPTGVAHTYMAAERLERAAKQLGHTIKVETQGSMGIENRLSSEEIRDADVALFAAAIAVRERERFAALRVVEVSVQDAIKDPQRILSDLAP
jgi:fructose-specific phosphotransferase system IIB component